MRKADLYEKINRNTILSNSNRVTPQHILTTDPFWMPDEELGRHSGVQIVELRSSASEQSYKNDDENEHLHSKDDDYKINEAAREKRRRCIANTKTPGDFQDNMIFHDDYEYSNYLYPSTSGVKDGNVIYNEVNCFTIYDKDMMNSDIASDDDIEDIELIHCGSPDWNCNHATDWNHTPMCDNELLRYQDQDPENDKRTVWIYSFKNNRLLSENDFELLNIPSTSSSIEIEDLDESKAIYSKPTRLPTPYPTNISKFKNSALPTVTEVKEPKVFLSQMKVKHNIEKRRLNGNNNWFSEQVTPKSENDTTKNSSSVLNWMALSPRDKKRRFRRASPLTMPNDVNVLPTVKEASSAAEKNDELPLQEETRDCGDSIKEFNTTIKYENVKSHDQGTNTEVLVVSTPSRKSVLNQMRTAVVDSARKSAKSLRSNVSSVFGSLTTAREQTDAKSPRDTAENENLNLNKNKTHSEERFSVDDQVNISQNPSPNIGRGDFSKRKPPRISIPTASAVKLPTESLRCSNWIEEKKLINDDHIRTPTDGKGDRASEALWARNMELLKPAEWTAYLPIVESIPSLQLSMNTDSIEGSQQTWLRRMAKFFKCCK